MQYLDLQVIEQAHTWLNSGSDVWLCTVLSTYGSSPREPGSMLVAKSDGQFMGSLSGGCVEEDFLQQLAAGALSDSPVLVSYGGDSQASQRVSLPCGGTLEVLVEHLFATPRSIEHIEYLLDALAGQSPMIRKVCLTSGELSLVDSHDHGPSVHRTSASVSVRVGPAIRLVLAGISSVTVFCAEFAKALGFEVIVCDPHAEACENFGVTGVEVKTILPSLFINAESCHAATAIVALTHDPRIDDLAMIEAVNTPAFYIGVMGSQATSMKRAERLSRSGNLSDNEIKRIHMPIGLALGSKTPAEIALAVMSDILRVYRGRERHVL